MPITITWDDGVAAVSSFTMPDETVASLELFRRAMTRLEGTQVVPVYADVKSMMIGILIHGTVLPAVRQFPPASVQAAVTNMEAAGAALIAAQLAVVPGFGGAR